MSQAFRDGRWDDAAESARRILRDLAPIRISELRPETVGEKAAAYLVLGFVHIDRGRYREAIKALHWGAAVASSNELRGLLREILNQLAIAQDKKGDLDEAERTYRRIVDRTEGGILWLGLGHVLRRKRDYSEAIRAYGRALADPRNPATKEIEDWIRDAYVGIVACVLELGEGRTGSWFDWWLRNAWRRSVAVLLFAGAILFIVRAGWSAWALHGQAAVESCAMVIGLIIVFLALPALRKLSLKDITVEVAETDLSQYVIPSMDASGMDVSRGD
jgi:tetratricopeptide (TPR) repeat protein